ncbi:MAG TPA: M67 family metallopeptidase [Terriglobia bacterium]|nr:M67 family metallopeptidase [Terriglobia bacterium]
MNLSLAPGLLEQVTEHAKTCHPQEGCGVLVGSQLATRFIPMDNATASSTDYEMDPAQLIGVLRDLRTSGEDLLAIYHSHPFGPAKPSKRDIERAYYPEAAHLIVSLAEPERPRAAAFRIIDGEVYEIEIHVIL